MIGRTVSHYRILAEIGRGGMGILYRARDERLERDVALKFLSESVASDGAAGDRFLREARAVSALNHPSICTIYDIGEDDGRPFLVLELLEGETLREAIRRGPLGVDALLRIAVSVLQALQAAHQRGIIHRDIKPENIFLTSASSVKLLDFGLAKLTDQNRALAGNATELTLPGSLVGTVSYMSPEQVRGEPLDERTDLYSFGMVLYEAATGQISTRKETVAASISAVLLEAPPMISGQRPDLPHELSELVFRATRKPVNQRFQSATEMLDWIAGFSPVGVSSNPGSSPAVIPRRSEPEVEATGQRPLVGRLKECRILQDLLSQSRCGRGKMVLIEGEPGIGKTCLLEYVLSSAESAGMRTLSGRCSELETGTPFLPFVEVLERLTQETDSGSLLEYLGPLAPEIGRLTPRIRRALPDIPAPLEVPPERERHLLFSAVKELIERLCRERPVVLALEDLHWSDAATSALIQHIAVGLSSLPLLIIGTHRPHTLEQNSAFADTLGALLRHRVIRRMPLSSLSDADVNLLLCRLAGRAVPPNISRSINQITEGNPFFIEELFDHLRDEGLLFDDSGRWKTDLSLEDFGVPQGILLVLSRRLERLSESTHALLRTAAVMGRRFRFDLLTSCQESPPAAVIEALEEAGRLGLVYPCSMNGDIVYAFSHALVRQTLIDLMSPPRRQAVHLRVADALESFKEAFEERPVIEIAHHLTAAGSMVGAARKLQYLSQAGDETLAKTAFQEAAGFYERALALVPEDPAVRGGLLFKKGLALTGLTRWQEAHAAWSEALELLETVGDRIRFGELCDIMSSQLIWLGQLEAAHRISRRGITILGDADEVRRVRLLAWAGHSRSQAGRLDEGAPLTDRALEEARRLHDSRLLGYLLTHKACEAFYRMRFQDAAESGEQACRLLVGSPWDHVESSVFRLLGLLGIGELGRVREIAQDSMAAATRIGHLASLWMLNRVLGMADLLEAGDLDSFKAFARQDLEFCRQAHLKWISEAYSWQGLAEWWSGDLESADRCFGEAVEIEPPDFSQGMDWGCRFLFLGFSGRRDEALSLLGEIDDRTLTKPQTAGGWSRLLLVVLGLAWLQEWDKAGALYPAVRSALDLGSAVLFNAVGLVETAVGVAAGAGGLWQEAEHHFEVASRTADRIPCRIDQAEIPRWHGELLLMKGDPGDRDRALAFLESAQQRYHQLHMPLHRQLTEQSLRGDMARIY
ncbi:MAG: protein kinase [Acidobacteriota bacterium]